MARLYSLGRPRRTTGCRVSCRPCTAPASPWGAPNGVPVVSQQFVPDVQWLQPSFVATQLHTSFTPAVGGKVSPGTHGHELNSVSVGGTTLQAGSTNTVPASPAPTFTLTFTNSGTNNETNVVCKVSLLRTRA